MGKSETGMKKRKNKISRENTIKKRRCIIMVHIVCTIENQSVLHRVFHTQRKKREMNKKKHFFCRAFFFSFRATVRPTFSNVAAFLGRHII